MRHGSPVRPAFVPDALRKDVFLGSDAVGAGLLTRRQLDSRPWRRLFRDCYVHADVAITHELRIVGACLLLPDAVVTGHSAAVLWGAELAGPDDDVEVTCGSGSHPRRIPGITVRRANIPSGDRWRRKSLPVTTATATTLRLASVLTGDEAVIAVDRMVACGAAELEAVRERAGAARGRGAARARRACALADGLAESPQETRLRLLMLRGGFPAPVAQHRVLDRRGGFVARVDFAWPELRVAVEYDGLWHAEQGQFAKDRRRLNRLREEGWTVVFVTAADLHAPEALIARIAAALSRGTVRSSTSSTGDDVDECTVAAGYSQPLRLKPR
jgi:very-short-patch-repair endonuclease